MPQKSFKVNDEYAKISEIIPGLFISGVSGLTLENIKKYQISMIINATTEVPQLKMFGNIARQKLWLEDKPDVDIYSFLDFLSDQIEVNIADGGNVLVHCVAGVSRSASICLAYLTKYKCRSLRDAYHLMIDKRPLVRPNLGFWQALITYEKTIKGNSGSVRLISDPAQQDNLLPDVYLRLAIQNKPESIDSSENASKKARNQANKIKFQPILETLSEGTEGIDKDSLVDKDCDN
ncbi:unnamed protein product [Dracunculus medinensis]|uniref:Protein-tyrosine-phosphatase n=1 Tax=Dracunculus medinensis TaxID=318479 RepID=A0A0N4UAN5_DRAME|nr:unnamed protein product [Dracunculus medinensis]